ncbi:MAG TPA: hypothetical protein VLM37_00050 [Fibrobacteraceae bacterium]|nr:hypothetical protein [Fibrobacteraceae bacterium]
MCRLTWIGSIGVVMSLISCLPKEPDVEYAFSSPVSKDVFHSGTYSTKSGEDGEEIGTITATYTTQTWTRSGDSTVLERHLLMDRSKGYHKNSMPLELSYRIPALRVVGRDLVILTVHGNEQFLPQVVENLPIKEKFKRQLRDARYSLAFDRYERKRWQVTHVLQGKIPIKSNVTKLLQEKGRLPLSSVPVDSVIVKGYHKLDERNCLEYSVFFKEREPFPEFMWEQYAYGTTAGKGFQAFRADSATYDVEYMVAIEPSTGVPCQEREVKKGINWMHNPETQEKASFVSFITMENLYTTPGKDD